MSLLLAVSWQNLFFGGPNTAQLLGVWWFFSYMTHQYDNILKVLICCVPIDECLCWNMWCLDQIVFNVFAPDVNHGPTILIAL